MINERSMSINPTYEDNLVNSLNSIGKGIIYSLIIPLIFGLIGNLGSLIVFCQKELRSNGISILFGGASMFNILVLMYGIIPSIYSVNSVSPESNSIIYCKFRLYIRHILLMTVRSYIVLGCATSFCLSSSGAKVRSLCKVQYIKYSLIVVPCIWMLIAIHMPLLTIIVNNHCVNVSWYVLPFSIYFFVIVGIIPIVLMVLFLFLTKLNLRLLNRRIEPSIPIRRRLKSRDQQFIRMLSALIVMYIITNLFYPINVLYNGLTYSMNKSRERLAIESLIFSLTSDHILYINNVSPFYLFIYSSKTFRKLFFNIIQKYFTFIINRTTRIQPLSFILSQRENNRQLTVAIE